MGLCMHTTPSTTSNEPAKDYGNASNTFGPAKLYTDCRHTHSHRHIQYSNTRFQTALIWRCLTCAYTAVLSKEATTKPWIGKLSDNVLGPETQTHAGTHYSLLLLHSEQNDTGQGRIQISISINCGKRWDTCIS